MKQFTVDDVLNVCSGLDLDQINPGATSEFDEANCEYAIGKNAAAGPSCLVGTVLFKLDKRLFGTIADSGSSASGLPDFLKRNFEDAAWKILEDAQYPADKGATWGEALERAGVNVERTYSLTI